MPCGENKPPKSKIRGACRETPRTGRSDGRRAKAKKEKVRLWKRKERMRKGHPGRMARRPHPSTPFQPPIPSPLLMKRQGNAPCPAAARPSPPCCLARTFRRNGVTVPAQRGDRSGATPSPFRRNVIAVPAQRHRRSGATGWPFRRNGIHHPARGGKTAAQDDAARARTE